MANPKRNTVEFSAPRSSRSILVPSTPSVFEPEIVVPSTHSVLEPEIGVPYTPIYNSLGQQIVTHRVLALQFGRALNSYYNIYKLMKPEISTSILPKLTITILHYRIDYGRNHLKQIKTVLEVI